MKKYFVLLLIGSVLSGMAMAQIGSGEPVPRGGLGRRGPGGGGFPGGRGETQEQAVADTNADISLPRFDLDFPGGKPKELVRAVEKAMRRPLNVVIPQENANAELPPLSVKGVTVVQLFQALAQASQKQEPYVTGYSSGPPTFGRTPSYAFVNTGYGFRTTGAPSENSIWYFFWDKVPSVPGLNAELAGPPPVCRFYQLAPYLAAGYKVEDITTAIETGWKMLNETNPPRISYHKDTKLLIAVGTDNKLGIIQDVLNHLPTDKPKSPAVPGKPVVPGTPIEN